MTRVLVVHHDLDMADIEVDGLRRAGYEVDQCAGPIGGSPCPVLHGERCWQVEKADVLVYDVWASGDGAQDLIADLRDLHPNKPVVLTSPGMMLDWAESAGPAQRDAGRLGAIGRQPGRCHRSGDRGWAGRRPRRLPGPIRSTRPEHPGNPGRVGNEAPAEFVDPAKRRGVASTATTALRALSSVPEEVWPVLARYHLRPAAILAVLATMIVAACSGGGENEPQALTVLEWAGYEAPDFWTDFQTANPDVAVDFEFGTTDADILSKMEGGSTADVFHFYTGWQQFYVDEGLVQEIDTSKLTNWDKVPEAMQELGQIDGKQYYVPWDWGFTSILYNTAHVDEVTSWDALFNADYDRPHRDVGRRAGRGDRLELHPRLGRDPDHR